jgi:hypothetical protein
LSAHLQFLMYTCFPVPKERAFITHKNERKNLPSFLTVLGGAEKTSQLYCSKSNSTLHFLTELLQPFHINNNFMYRSGVYNNVTRALLSIVLNVCCFGGDNTVQYFVPYLRLYHPHTTLVPRLFRAPPLKHKKFFVYHTRFFFITHRRWR